VGGHPKSVPLRLPWHSAVTFLAKIIVRGTEGQSLPSPRPPVIFRSTDTWSAAIHLMASGAVDLDSLVTGFGLDRAAEAVESDGEDPDAQAAGRIVDHQCLCKEWSKGRHYD
jgi:hypothetical protein